MNQGSSKKKVDASESAPLLPYPQDRIPPSQTIPPEVQAAMMAQYGTTSDPNAPTYPNAYYADPAAVAAAFAHHAQASGGQQQPPFFFPGYPPPPQQGYFPQHGYMYSTPMSATLLQTAATASNTNYSAGPPQRPPRSQKRFPGTKSGSPKPSNVPGSKKTFSESSNRTAPFQQNAYNSFSGHDSDESSGIPSVQDIFSDSQPLLPSHQQQQQPTSTSGGYGATAMSPEIYNAPPRSTNTSNSSGAKPRLVPILVRANSSGDEKQHPLKRSNSGGHRRTSSDLPLRGVPPSSGSHRRVGSSGELPPSFHRRKMSGGSGSRGRSYSAGQFPANSQGKRPTQRRRGSLSSMVSNVSMSSVVSNIAKSEFFGGVDGKGRVQMHFPFEAVRLVMIDPEQPSLRQGHLYLDGHADDFDQFEEYHRMTAESDGYGIPAPQWESLDRPANVALPKASYLLAVNRNVYKEIVGEIADAHSMPCGLFFCGHHEDVAHPSILIAVILVTILFASLIYLAIQTEDLIP